MLLLFLLCGKKWANESCLCPNTNFIISMLLNTQQDWETTQTVCGSLCAEPRLKKKKKKKSRQSHKNKFKCF